MRRLDARWFCALLLLSAAEVHADEAELKRVVADLEARVRELESTRLSDAGRSGWADQVRLSGSVNNGFYAGQHNSVYEEDSFDVFDARFFVDAELGGDVRAGDVTLLRNAGVTFEWNLVRIGRLYNNVGELYVDLQGIAGSEWLNAQVGRFQIPVGEAYLRYSRGFADNPFVENPVGGPWWWDEGIRFYGSDADLGIGYVASVSNGETPFNVDEDPAKQITLKLYADPFPWFHVSASAMRSGGIGSNSSPASGALWLGETWARAFGSGSGVANYDHGQAIADGPNKLHDSWFVGGDLILRLWDIARLWLAYGYFAIDSTGPSTYDRDLQYWIAELQLEGGTLLPALDRVYLALRADGLGTYNDDEGYLLDFRYAGSLGYNMKALRAYTIALGWELTRYLRVRAEYGFRDIDLVRGVPDSISRNARDANVFALELGVQF